MALTTMLKSFGSKCAKAMANPRFGTMFMMLFMVTVAFAQNAAGGYDAGTAALGTVTTEIAKYVPVAVKLCYAIAGVVAVVGAISVYINITSQLTMPFR